MTHDATTPAQPDAPAQPDEPTTSPPTDSSTVPIGVRAASEWSWRLLLIAAAVIGVTMLLREFSQIVVPVVVALLLAALLRPTMRRLQRVMPRGAAAGVTVVGTVIVISGLLILVGRQFSSGLGELTSQLAAGIEQIRDWIRTTFNITDSQFDQWFEDLRNNVGQSGNIGQTATSVGLTATHFIAGTFIALFALFFYLYDGERIWRWLVQLFPRRARERVDSSGHIAWGQLSAFVRATVIVAAVDAIGISVGAAILRVPFAFAIGVLVFILSFIPIVGALLSGAVAVLLALVAHGPGVALIMLAVVIGVQQLESHVLQPFLLGRAVHVHPLAVILAIAAGTTVAGIVGALAAVPLAAVANAVGKHLFAGESRQALEVELAQSADEGEAPART